MGKMFDKIKVNGKVEKGTPTYNSTYGTIDILNNGEIQRIGGNYIIGSKIDRLKLKPSEGIKYYQKGFGDGTEYIDYNVIDKLGSATFKELNKTMYGTTIGYLSMVADGATMMMNNVLTKYDKLDSISEQILSGITEYLSEDQQSLIGNYMGTDTSKMYISILHCSQLFDSIESNLFEGDFSSNYNLEYKLSSDKFSVNPKTISVRRNHQNTLGTLQPSTTYDYVKIYYNDTYLGDANEEYVDLVVTDLDGSSKKVTYNFTIVYKEEGGEEQTITSSISFDYPGLFATLMGVTYGIQGGVYLFNSDKTSVVKIIYDDTVTEFKKGAFVVEEMDHFEFEEYSKTEDGGTISTIAIPAVINQFSTDFIGEYIYCNKAWIKTANAQFMPNYAHNVVFDGQEDIRRYKIAVLYDSTASPQYGLLEFGNLKVFKHSTRGMSIDARELGMSFDEFVSKFAHGDIDVVVSVKKGDFYESAVDLKANDGEITFSRANGDTISIRYEEDDENIIFAEN